LGDASISADSRKINKGGLTRDFVHNCHTTVLILPDDVPAHPYAVAWECAMLGPKAEVSVYPWKGAQGTGSAGRAPDTFFLRAHRSAST